MSLKNRAYEQESASRVHFRFKATICRRRFSLRIECICFEFCDICKYVSLFSKITKINRFTVGKLGFCTNDLNRISNVLQSKWILKARQKKAFKMSSSRDWVSFNHTADDAHSIFLFWNKKRAILFYQSENLHLLFRTIHRNKRIVIVKCYSRPRECLVHFSYFLFLKISFSKNRQWKVKEEIITAQILS